MGHLTAYSPWWGSGWHSSVFLAGVGVKDLAEHGGGGLAAGRLG
jgi:hypothetical protein